MQQPTAPCVRRPAIFAPGGLIWIPVPVGMTGPAREAWVAILRAGRRSLEVTAPDRILARLAGVSPRTIQAGLRALELSGMIARLRRAGGRVITILGRLAGGEKPARATHSQAAAPPSRNPSPHPSYEGKKLEEEAAGSIDREAIARPLGPEAPPPPGPARSFLERLPVFARAFASAAPPLGG